MGICSYLLIFCAFSSFCADSTLGSNTYETYNGFPKGVLDYIVDSPIVQKRINSRWQWEAWDIVPGKHAFHIYIFNLTNADDFEARSKPKVEQLGPYVFIESRTKFNVSINLDLTVNYERNFSYTFEPNLSNGTLNDKVNVLNFPLVVFATVASKFSIASIVNMAVNTLTRQGETLIKRNVKVNDLIFHGVDVSKYKPYVNLMGQPTTLTNLFDSGRYSLLKLKVGAHEGAYVVDSGLRDLSRTGKIIEWNGQNQLYWWSEEGSCNDIDGSEGSSFLPLLSTDTKPQILDLDLCRSITFEYNTTVTFRTISADRFMATSSSLEDPRVNKNNLCFCNHAASDASNCLKSGVLDVSNCKKGAPIVMSYANFLHANPEYTKAIDGIVPDEEKHQSLLDLEPITGAVVHWRKRYQYNIWLKSILTIDYFRNRNEIIFPVLWNNDEFNLNEDKVELLIEEVASVGGGVGKGSTIKMSFAIYTLVGIIYLIM